jgi:hypothetical protein
MAAQVSPRLQQLTCVFKDGAKTSFRIVQSENAEDVSQTIIQRCQELAAVSKQPLFFVESLDDDGVDIEIKLSQVVQTMLSGTVEAFFPGNHTTKVSQKLQGQKIELVTIKVAFKEDARDQVGGRNCCSPRQAINVQMSDECIFIMCHMHLYKQQIPDTACIRIRLHVCMLDTQLHA